MSIAAWSLFLVSLPVLTDPQPPPNIVLILADDLGADDLAPARAPNLDRLAREGMQFSRAFVTASSCSPSRASLITGRPPHATGAEELHWPLPAGQSTFVQALRSAGYWTAAAGKWHLGDAAKSHFDQVRDGGTAAFIAPNAPGGRPVRDESGCAQWVPTLRDRPADRPFFLWLAAFDPHRDYHPGAADPPHDPKDVVVPPYLVDDAATRADLAAYYDEITRLDDYVGKILDEIDRQGIADQTLVLFLSDNGRPFPRCKTTLYDSGLRTPLIARWPGRVPTGTTCQRLISTIDVAPTLLELIGRADAATGPGRSFVPQLADPAAPGQTFIHAERNWHDYAARGRAVRSERFKYIRNDDADRPLTPPADAVRSPSFASLRALDHQAETIPAQAAIFAAPRPAEELYDLDADPHELHNLIGQPTQAKRVAEYRAELRRWAEATGDQPPGAVPLTPDEFDRTTGAPLPNRRRPRVRP